MADTILQILQWAIPSGGIGAAIAWVANRKAREAKTAKEVHDTYKAMYEDISTLLVETQKKYEETKEQIEALGTENSRTRRALNRLSRAIEAIQVCPHRGNCPVSSELSFNEDADEGKSVRTKPVRGKGQRNGEYHGSEQKTRESTDVGGETDTADGQFPTASSRSRIHSATGTGKSESETESTDGESTGIIDNRSQLRQLGTGSGKLLKDHQHAEISFENSEKVE